MELETHVGHLSAVFSLWLQDVASFLRDLFLLHCLNHPPMVSCCPPSATTQCEAALLQPQGAPAPQVLPGVLLGVQGSLGVLGSSGQKPFLHHFCHLILSVP